MEGRKQVGSSSSSSSFTSELFGSRENSASSSGIFGSIFAPPSKAMSRGFQRPKVTEKKPDSSKETWSNKPDDTYKSGESVSSIYEEQRVQPCHLSSSIYYGGQDVYSQPQTTSASLSNATFKKDGGEDDSGSASRGNWWQGSLYY